MEGYTYFTERNGLIKIGHLDTPRLVLSGLDKEPQRFLFAVSAERVSAEEARAQFAHLKSRGHWFHQMPDLIEFMESLGADEVSINVVEGDKRWIDVDRDVSRLMAIQDANPNNPAIWNRCNIGVGLLREWSTETNYAKRAEQVLRMKNLKKEFAEYGVNV